MWLIVFILKIQLLLRVPISASILCGQIIILPQLRMDAILVAKNVSVLMLRTSMPVLTAKDGQKTGNFGKFAYVV